MQIKKDIYNSIQSEKVYIKGVGSDIKLDLQLDFNNKEPNIESSISGQVVDENNVPIEGAIVKLMDEKLQPLTNTTTNSNGNYSFNFFPYSNIYNLMSIASGRLLSQVAPFSLSKGQNLNFDFTLKTDVNSNFATLSGTALNTNAKGISGAIILLYSMINGVNTLIAITHTDVAGIFVFNELTPGDYSITITALGYIQGNSTVNIKKGIITTFSKILYEDPKAENGIISGIITDSLNNVISEAKVILYKVELDNELTPISATKTNNKGIYTFINVPTGVYFIKSNQSELVTVNAENTINSITSITSASSKNLALNKKAVSSSNETDYFTPNLVTDGNNTSASSRWSSGTFTNGEHQWIYVDLGEITEFDTVKLYWEVANATIYRIEISNDATSWTSVYRTTESMGGVETITLTSTQNARYVRVYCEKNNTIPSVSLYEIEIYNRLINIAEGKRIYGRNAHEKNNLINAVDGDLNTYWDGGQYPSYLEIDLEKVYALDSINIVNYVDGARYYYYSIYGSKDGVNYNKIAKKNNDTKATIEGDNFKFNNDVEARYVRVLIEYCSANEAAHISELKVYGKETGEIGTSNKAINIQNFVDTEYANPITMEDTLNEITEIIARRLGSQYINWFDFNIKVNTNNLDYFQISNSNNGKIKIEGNNGISLTTGLNYYLKYICKVQITELGDPVKMPILAPRLDMSIRKETPYEIRYAHNYCTFSYTMAFWSDEQWQVWLDWLALNGVNLVLDLNAQDEVWRRFLGELGYDIVEIKNWLVGPAYMAWQYMGNMGTFGGPLPDQWFEARTELARKMQRKMKALGMKIVLQGYAGMVPTDIKDKRPNVEIIPQGTWCSFERPAMLRTDSADYKEFARIFYKCQEEVYGKYFSNYYATDPFHEGGTDAGMSRATIYKETLNSMLEYDSEAVWVIQSWRENPAQEGLNGIIPERRNNILVLDLYAELDPRWIGRSNIWGYKWDEPEFDGTPWVWNMLNNFGGRMGIHGQLGVLATEIPNAYKTTSTGKTSHMKGIGITPEALESNPVLFDLLFEMAWTTDTVNVELWLKDYIERRYGKYTDNSYKAWKVFNETAYAKRTHYHEGAPESIINARPKFEVRSSALVGSITVLYDKIKFEKAVKLLLADYDELKDYPGYLFDLADYLRQVLVNFAPEYYNKFVSLYNANDSVGFKLYANKFLNIIKLQEKILSTQRVFLVGTWMKYAKEIAFDEFSTDMFKLNAKALITTWGGLLQSEAGGLRDYSNRQWSGLTGDFYYGRWEMWINSLKNAIDTGTEPKNIDWFKFDWTWVLNNKEYSSEPTNFSLKDLGNEVFTKFSYLKDMKSVLSENLVLNKKAVSSSNETDYFTPNLVTDGNNTSASSRWSSGTFTNGEHQWIYVDLGEITEFDTVKLYWEVANATIYRIEVSNDATNWTSVYRTTESMGGVEKITLTSTQNARYVRVYCEKNNTIPSVSLYEIEIYNRLINIAEGKPVYGRTVNEKNNLINAVDGDLNTYWDGGQYPSYLEIDLEKIYALDSINIVNYVDGVRYYHYSIYGSRDRINYNKIAEKNNNNKATTEGDTFKLNGDIEVRYVKVTIEYCSANEAAHISELGIYGKEVSQMGTLTKNLALNKKAVSSSNETDYFTPNLVTDGNNTSASSRWSSGPFTNGEHQWIYVDLGEITEFDTVKLYWEVANATIYRIQISDDATNWASVYRTTEGIGEVEKITLTSTQSARYVRVYCEKNNTIPSVSLYEIEIYNMGIMLSKNLALNKKAVSSSDETDYFTPNLVTDGNNTLASSRWSSGPFTNGEQQWIYVDLGKITNFDTIKLYWEVANATIYRIEVSNDITNWTSVYRTTNGLGEIEIINLNSTQSARYIRIYCEKNNTVISVSLYEIEIYNIRNIAIPILTTKNLALNKKAVSLSNETDYFTPNLVTDGNNTSASSRWSSGPFTNEEHQWIYVDLGEITEFDTVKLYWEVANATIYRIEISNDATNWTSVYRTTEGMGGVEKITLTSTQSARYVRVYCEKNNTVISVSLYEIEIYNMIINNGMNIAKGKRIYGRNAHEKNRLINAIDGDLNTYWDGGQYPSYLEIDLEKVYALDSINIVNYVDGVRYYYYSIYGSKDGVNYNKIAKKNNNTKATTEGDTFKFNNDVEARYVRVLIEYCSANEAAHISELKVCGKETGEIGILNKAINIQNFADTEYANPITMEETLNEITGIIARRLGSQYINWFDFSIKANTNNLDYFQISNGDNGKIKIEGNNGVSLTTGLNYYLKYFCKVQITEFGDPVKMPIIAPRLDMSIRKETPYEIRYAHNYCTFSYTMAFWSDEQWQVWLDWLALNGVNLVLDLNAQDEVWRRFLGELGYDIVEIKNWLVGPAYMAWQYMGNMGTFGGPLPDQWFEARTELARKMQRKMKALGMKIVLQGYAGMVPTDIKDKRPNVDIIPQGTWCSFERPAMLRTDSTDYKEFARIFYKCQEEVYGKYFSNYYATDPFHEGGTDAGMSRATIYKETLNSMLEYDNKAVWVIQSWRENPAQEGLNGIIPERRNNILVLDLYAELDPRWIGRSNIWGYKWDEPEFDGTPWVWNMLNNFGGRMGIHGQLGVLATEIPNAYKTTSTGKTSHMKGIGITPEALESNPVLFDLLFEMAWTTDAVNVELWLKDYIERRYGKYTDNAYNAWKVFNETAYAKRTHYHEGAPESIINARPKFGVRSSALVGSITVLYDKIKFEEAVKLLLADYDELKDYPGYLFDLADYLRQVLANSAQEYYNKFVSLYNANDSVGFKLYADKFLNLIKLQEKILSTQRVFSVGTWIKYAKEEAFDDFSTDMFKLNAKALITTWGGLLQSEAGGLRDYSNRQWSGLTGDFYYGRWEMWINSLKNAIDTGTEPKNIDWFKFDWTWVINNKEYSSKPTSFSLKDLGNEVFANFSYSKLI